MARLRKDRAFAGDPPGSGPSSSKAIVTTGSVGPEDRHPARLFLHESPRVNQLVRAGRASSSRLSGTYTESWPNPGPGGRRWHELRRPDDHEGRLSGNSASASGCGTRVFRGGTEQWTPGDGIRPVGRVRGEGRRIVEPGVDRAGWLDRRTGGRFSGQLLHGLSGILAGRHDSTRRSGEKAPRADSRRRWRSRDGGSADWTVACGRHVRDIVVCRKTRAREGT